MNWKTIICQIILLTLFSSEIFSQFSENRNYLISDQNLAGSVNKADVNNDGFEDFIIQDNQGLSLYKNEENGQFSTYLITDRQVWDEILLDVNLDGDIDILGYLPNEEELAWLENDGRGNFSEPKIIDGSKNQLIGLNNQFFPADFDADKDVDLLFRVGDSAYKWFVNDGEGNFSLSTNTLTLEGVDHAVTTDIDKNGIINLVVFSPFFEQSEIAYYALDSRGNLLGRRIITNDFPVSGDLYSLLDIDNDQDTDLITSHGWYKNDGVGNFTYQENIFEELGHSCMDVEWVDIDNDRDLDAVLIASCNVSSVWDTHFGWYENDGEGNFSEFKIIHDFFHIHSSITTLDVENDGDLDIVISVNSNAVHKVIWYENLINLPPIVAIPFWDENNDGLFDNSSEHQIKNINLQASPAPLSVLSNLNGMVNFYLEEGVYDFSLSTNFCWELSAENNLTNINYSGRRDTMYIALKRIFPAQSSIINVNTNRTRCGFQVAGSISLENDGCAPIDGKFGLVLDEKVDLVTTEIAPNEIRGDTILWDLSGFDIEEIQKIKLELKMPGPEFIGQWIKLTGLSYIENEQGVLELSDSYEYTSEIRCAYDPNDKLVVPNRLADFDQNYTLFNEALDYTIRFQNTGNDTAFTVVIRDTLDENLDWTTFKPLLGSHSFETRLYSDGLIEFTFDNILLPDSTTNEPASHGYINFKISPNKNLPENTLIKNTAGIYFDFNPPIITNTTQNVLVSALPRTTFLEVVDLKKSVKVYPNPVNDFFTITYEETLLEEAPIFEIFDMTGKLIKSTTLTTGTQRIATNQLASGIYFYKVIEKNGQLFASGKLALNKFH